jgi:hypothetical protein
VSQPQATRSSTRNADGTPLSQRIEGNPFHGKAMLATSRAPRTV